VSLIVSWLLTAHANATSEAPLDVASLESRIPGIPKRWTECRNSEGWTTALRAFLAISFFLLTAKMVVAADVRIVSIDVYPPVVAVGDVIGIDIKVENRVDRDVRVLATIDAPGFNVLVGNQSKILRRYQSGVLTLILKAIEEGEYRVTVRLYEVKDSTLVEVENINGVIGVLGRAKLTVIVYDIIFHTPVNDAVVLARCKYYNCEFLLNLVEGNIYAASLAKTSYDIIVNEQVVIKSFLLNEDRTITVETFSSISVAILSLLIIISSALSAIVIKKKEKLSNILVVTAGWLPFLSAMFGIILFSLWRLRVGMLEPSVLFGMFALFTFFLLLQIPVGILVLIRERIQVRQFRQWTEYSNEWKVLELARRYVVLTPEVVAYELRIPMEKASNILKKFVEYGSAERRKMGGVVVYVFPGVLMQLSPLARQVIGVLLENPQGVALPELLRVAGPMELRAALEELKSQGVVVESGGVYRLRGLSPVRSGEG